MFSILSYFIKKLLNIWICFLKTDEIKPLIATVNGRFNHVVNFILNVLH